MSEKGMVMSKPKTITEGHSSGPQAYWDSISDAEKDAEIERLRELVAAGKNDRKAIDELVDENLRLYVLLKDIHECGDISPSLWDRIVSEVGDE